MGKKGSEMFKFHRFWRQQSHQVLKSDNSHELNIIFWQGSRSSTGSLGDVVGGGGGGDYSASGRMLAPPMPPIAPQPKLRRINSSTLSLTKHKRKMLTVSHKPHLNRDKYESNLNVPDISKYRLRAP